MRAIDRTTKRAESTKAPLGAAPKPSASRRKHDVFSAQKRSEIMKQVRSTGNKTTELKMIEEFKKRGIKGWRRNSKLIGHPDFVFPKLRVAVFVDGCFWHGHDCRNTKPKDHQEYWRAKIVRNQARDKASTERLQRLGYVVIRIWECDFKKANADKLGAKLQPLFDVVERLKRG